MTTNKDQLIDIYDIWYKPFWQPAWFSIIINICLCVVLLYGIYFFYKKYIQKKVAIDPAIVAYYDLDTLGKIHIVTEQDSKDCYFSLSSIVKRYLSGRYHIIFNQLTDKEIIQYAHHYMTLENVQILRQIFQKMIFVKFEHEIVVHQKLAADIQLIKEFIQNTSQQRDTKGF